MRALGAFTLGVVSTVAFLTTRPQQPVTPAANNTQFVDTTRFVAHNEHIQAGLVFPRDTITLRNPFEGNPEAVATGAKLYVAYNCVDCHGADGSGAMAPAFVDGRWHFGGSPAAVYQSIAEGRPDGMPAWGGVLNAPTIWRLVAYVRSLERGKDVATENFTGKTVERTGH